MNHSTRIPCIAANWKMNPISKNEAEELANKLKNISKIDIHRLIIVFIPFPYIDMVTKILSKTNIKVGAQDCFHISSGAYTSAISVDMIKSMGCSYILAGHSERRTLFGDNNIIINNKVHAILNKNLKCVLCIGENKEEYNEGLNKYICANQLSKGLLNVSEKQLQNIIIAYEPVWAIGTGLTATPKIADDVHKYIN